MRHQLAAYLDYVITFILFIVAGLTPLIFFNQMTEFYEMPKLVFLIVTTIILIGLWIFSWIVKGKIVFTRTPLDVPLLILLVVILISTFFSSSHPIALYGNFPRVNGSAVSWVVYILLYFVTVSHLKDLTKIRMFLNVLYVSAIIVSVLTLAAFFHLFLPFDFAQALNFTPTGSTFSTIAFLLLLLPLPLLSVIHPNKYLPIPLSVALVVLFGATVILTGSIASMLALLAAFALCFFLSKPHQVRKTFLFFLLPVAILAVVLFLANVPFTGNALQQLEANFPKEIQIPFTTSWVVSVSAFRDAPFFGTGPASYLFNFTTYKPVDFNTLPYWNFTFDTAYDEFLQILGTLGIFGFLSLLLVVIVIIVNSWKNLAVDTQDARQDNTHILVPAMAVSGLMVIILFAIHDASLVSTVVSLFILAVLMMSQRSIRERVTELRLGIKASTADNQQFDLFPIILFIVFVIAAIPVLYKTVTMTAADFYHHQALVNANTNGAATYQNLQKAETLSPQIDLYRVDMAQTNFALANAIAAKAIPQNGKPATLTAQDRQTIQTLLAQAINEGQASIALSPRSARNWEVLASIYQNISGVAQNALAFSLAAYSQAVRLDPLNPTLRLNIGGIYYSVQNYDLATRFYTDAANLKPDYTNAYYNLAVAYRDKGDLPDALVVANQAVTLEQSNKGSQSYQIAQQLLTDIKTKMNGKGQTAQPAAPTPTPTGGALQNGDVKNVNVNGVNNQPTPQVTPPAAVKKNPKANLPQK
jgi:tetratricopeptide (TPR) repeat protein/O-antigen ligase